MTGKKYHRMLKTLKEQPRLRKGALQAREGGGGGLYKRKAEAICFKDKELHCIFSTFYLSDLKKSLDHYPTWPGDWMK